MNKNGDKTFVVRTILWLVSIYLVAIPLKAVKHEFGSAVYLAVGLGTIAIFFYVGILYTNYEFRRKAKKKRG